MKRYWNNKGRTIINSKLLALCSMFCIGILLWWMLYPRNASPGPYLDSTHGSSSSGVKRSATGFPTDYGRGNCAHCHEQHASIGGAEPNPTGGPDKYLLGYQNVPAFCFGCHRDTGSYQTGGYIYNRSYSYRAGGWTADTLNDILEAFSFISPGSSHKLSDIKTFINGKWNYTTDSNPCCACHNPHRAQGDPANAPNSAKTSGTRGWPVSRPSQHSTDNNAWGLWGDVSTERMSNYTASYQAPYRFNSTTTYEPDGSTTTDGSNLTDFNTFCTDCHNATNTIYSTTLGRNLKKIDWETTGGDSSGGDKHGKNSATTNICIDPPYYSTSSCTNTGLGKVLSCLDCHEPHGAPNNFLIRKEVNGNTLSGTVSTGTKDYGYLCMRCHREDTSGSNTWENIHHSWGDYPYNQMMCGSCHDGMGGPIRCSNCHYHGSSVTNARTPATRRTF
ncbi:MAG: cytochrome c3 family protein [Nitrospirota bacterium]